MLGWGLSAGVVVVVAVAARWFFRRTARQSTDFGTVSDSWLAEEKAGKRPQWP